MVISTPVPVVETHAVTSYQRVVVQPAVLDEGVGRRMVDYFVDVPPGLYPGDVFNVSIADQEFMVVCPDISLEGERIVVSVVNLKM